MARRQEEPLEFKTWEIDDFIEGSNTLPQTYHWSALAGNGEAALRASLSPDFGTRPEEPRSSTSPTLLLRMTWADAIRLAVEITRMAQATGQPIPPDVFIRGATH